MYNGLVHAHSGLRWVVLLVLIVAVIQAGLKWRSRKKFTSGDRRLGLFTLIGAHIQLILGLWLYFISPKVLFSGEAMKDKILRFFTAEHFAIMLLAIIFITVGYARVKRTPVDQQKFRITFMYYFSALILILYGIPWPFWGYGTGWF